MKLRLIATAADRALLDSAGETRTCAGSWR